MLGVHQVKVVVQASSGLSSGRVLAQLIHSGRLIIDLLTLKPGDTDPQTWWHWQQWHLWKPPHHDITGSKTCIYHGEGHALPSGWLVQSMHWWNLQQETVHGRLLPCGFTGWCYLLPNPAATVLPQAPALSHPGWSRWLLAIKSKVSSSPCPCMGGELSCMLASGTGTLFVSCAHTLIHGVDTLGWGPFTLGCSFYASSFDVQSV